MGYLRSIGLRFEEIIHEDELFTVQLLLGAHKAMLINNITIKRRLRENSIITADDNWEAKAKGKLHVAYRLNEILTREPDAFIGEALNKQINQMLNKSIPVLVKHKGETDTQAFLGDEYYAKNPVFHNMTMIIMNEYIVMRKKDKQIAELKEQLKDTKAELTKANKEIKKIKNSRGWKLILWIRKVKKRVKLFRK